MSETTDIMRLLGYAERWLTYGFLSYGGLIDQRDAFTTSGDRSTEHYRYQSFCAFLSGRLSISDEEIACYVELAEIDADQTMAGSALADLLRWRGLTHEQFEHLAAHRSYQVDFLQRLVRRRRLLEAIDIGPVSDALVEACLASNDGDVQGALVAADSMTPEHLKALVRGGRNRAIRNSALARLGRRQDPPN